MTARVTFNGKNLDFNRDVDIVPWHPLLVGTQKRSFGGSCETLSIRTDLVCNLTWSLLTNAGIADSTTVRKLRQLSQWAQEGNVFEVMTDNTKTVNTTITADVLEDASSVVVASATGITVGREYILRDTLRVQLVKVSGIAGTTISFSEAIDFPFFSGARFRDVEYWQARIAPGSRNVSPVMPSFHSGSIDFIEDVDGLPEGAEMDHMDHVDNETPSGTIDGSNVTFTLAYTPIAGSVMLFRMASRSGFWILDDYTVTGSTITMSFPPTAGDTLKAYYRK